MSEVKLQKLKFPGLESTYTIPVVDNTLTEEGAAADAKATGDKIAKSVEGLATETFVTTKIAEASLGGGDTNIDLSGYATKDDITDVINDTQTKLDAKSNSDHTHYGATPIPFKPGDFSSINEYGTFISRMGNTEGYSGLSDNYYFGVTSSGKIYCGLQLNGTPNITWSRALTNRLDGADYGTSLPSAGTAGRIFFKKV